MTITKSQLIDKPEKYGRHIVFLGAGTSVQAFPDGDANGRILPTMDNLVEILDLKTVLDQCGVEYKGRNFEVIYSEINKKNPHSALIKKINEIVYTYFSNLKLPEQPTLYDHLLLSLRPKDLVASFNWDPFLHDAWERNEHIVPLPQIAYLHGNVRVGYCLEHRIKGKNDELCPECNRVLTPSQLLYPVTMKRYNDDAFIKNEWELLKLYLSKAFTLTIFGYSAPSTDEEAIELMKSAWNKNNRLIERIEIIDKKDETILQKQWNPFIVRTYFDCHKDFYQSRIPNLPRRTCEALLASTRYGQFVENNLLPINANFDELISWIQQLVKAEQ